MKCIAFLLFLAAVFAGVFLLMTEAASRSERAECEQWSGQSKEYHLWYSTDWQKAQCRTYGIELK